MATLYARAINNNSARITVPEICRRLQLGERAVYALLEAKIIPAIRRGNRWLIARYGYEQWEKDFGQCNTNTLH